MKKTSLLVALPAVALSGLLLTGCGAFRSHKAWDTALQEAPLEIPPTLDRPSTTEALVIPPPGGNQPTANGATARVGSSNGQISDGFVVADGADSVYRRVGQALEGGNLGEVIAIRDMMYLSMSYDHRLVDGADAARFLSHVKTRLEEGDFGSEFGL